MHHIAQKTKTEIKFLLFQNILLYHNKVIVKNQKFLAIINKRRHCSLTFVSELLHR